MPALLDRLNDSHHPEIAILFAGLYARLRRAVPPELRQPAIWSDKIDHPSCCVVEVKHSDPGKDHLSRAGNLAEHYRISAGPYLAASVNDVIHLLGAGIGPGPANTPPAE